MEIRARFSPPEGGARSTRAPEIMAAMISMLDNRSMARFLSYGGIAILAALELNEVARTHPGFKLMVGTLADTALIAVAWVLLMVRYQRDMSTNIGPLLIVVVGAASVALIVLSPQGAAVIGAIVALSMAANRFDLRTGIGFAALLIAAFLVANDAVNGFGLIGTLSYGLGLSFAFMASSSVARLRESEARAKLLLAKLQTSRDAQVQAAALNERARIAREIHDVLAHTLAALAVQLEGARLTLERHGSDAEALAIVGRSHRLAKEGLDEVRSAVSALRGDRVPGPSQLRDLVNDFEADTGVESAFQVDGDAQTLSSEAQLALYRTAQEALTNVRKHADASRVEVALRYRTEGTELEIADVGRSRDAPANGEGHGLVGMRERAELLGGSLDAGPTADGFQVRLWIPA